MVCSLSRHKSVFNFLCTVARGFPLITSGALWGLPWQKLPLKGWKGPDKTGMIFQKWQDRLRLYRSWGYLSQTHGTRRCAFQHLGNVLVAEQHTAGQWVTSENLSSAMAPKRCKLPRIRHHTCTGNKRRRPHTQLSKGVESTEGGAQHGRNSSGNLTIGFIQPETSQQYWKKLVKASQERWSIRNNCTNLFLVLLLSFSCFLPLQPSFAFAVLLSPSKRPK